MIPVLVHRLVGGKARAYAAVAHEAELALELLRHPVIVGVEVGDEAAARVLEGSVAGLGSAAVLGLSKNAEARVAGGVGVGHRRGAVRGAVVHEDGLPVRHRLRDERVQGLGKILLAVVERDDHAHQGLCIHGHRPVLLFPNMAPKVPVKHFQSIPKQRFRT